MNAQSILGNRLLDFEASAMSKLGAAERGESFAKSVGGALASANDDLNRAEDGARDLAAGRGDLVDTMIAMGRADLSLRLVVNMRNRVIESYNEIMRLQV